MKPLVYKIDDLAEGNLIQLIGDYTLEHRHLPLYIVGNFTCLNRLTYFTSWNIKECHFVTAIRPIEPVLRAHCEGWFLGCRDDLSYRWEGDNNGHKG